MMRIESLFHQRSVPKMSRRTKRMFIILNVMVIAMVICYFIVIPKSDFTSDVGQWSLIRLTPEESHEKVKQIDDYLNKLSHNDSALMSVSRSYGKSSSLIFPDAINQMTSMVIDNHCDNHGDGLLLLIMVFNRVEDEYRRQKVRNSWGNDVKSNVKLLFALGLSRDSKVQSKILEEQQLYNDIVQWNYYDSYYNCTIKSIGIIRWTALNCPNVKYVLKIDDDSLPVMNRLIEFVDNIPPLAIYGHLWAKAHVIRNSTASKWSISVNDYPGKFYPNYIGGPWLIPGASAVPLYETAIMKSLPALPFEDAYITGIVASKLNIPRKRIPNNGVVYLNDESCKLFELDLCWYNDTAIYWQGINGTILMDAWKWVKQFNDKLLNGQIKCPESRFGYLWSLLKYMFSYVIYGKYACFHR